MKKHPFKDNEPRCDTRAQAQACGARVYFTGKPCRHGHVSTRLTSTGACSACRQQQQFKGGNRTKRHCEDYLVKLGHD